MLLLVLLSLWIDKEEEEGEEEEDEGQLLYRFILIHLHKRASSVNEFLKVGKNAANVKHEMQWLSQ